MGSPITGDPWRSPSSNPLPGQDHLEQQHRDTPRGVFSVSKGRIHNLPGKLFQCSATLNVNKSFLTLKWNFLWFSLFLQGQVSSTGAEGPSSTPLLHMQGCGCGSLTQLRRRVFAFFPKEGKNPQVCRTLDQVLLLVRSSSGGRHGGQWGFHATTGANT